MKIKNLKINTKLLKALFVWPKWGIFDYIFSKVKKK